MSVMDERPYQVQCFNSFLTAVGHLCLLIFVGRMEELLEWREDIQSGQWDGVYVDRISWSIKWRIFKLMMP